MAIPIICDIELDRNKIELAGNVVNSNYAISNLPSDAIIEVSIRVDANGVHPVKVGELPEAMAALCNLQIFISKLLLEAYIERSKKLILQAIIL